MYVVLQIILTCLCVFLIKLRDMSVMTRVPNLFFHSQFMTLYFNEIIEKGLPIIFVYFVSHASAQALRPIKFTQRFKGISASILHLVVMKTYYPQRRR